MKIPAIVMLEDALRTVMCMDITEKDRIARLQVILEAAAHIKKYSYDYFLKIAKRAVRDAGLPPFEDPYTLNLNVHCIHTMSPLHLCARRGELDCLVYLIKAGADVNVVSDKKCTPLVEAFKHQREKCLAVLLACHPKMSLDEYYDSDYSGNSAVAYAMNWKFRPEVIFLILGFGAKVYEDLKPKLNQYLARNIKPSAHVQYHFLSSTQASDSDPRAQHQAATLSQ
ncbi:MAG: ankyrin repeat domain-containing protein [Gammaproteobacteria bacterium]|nr:ankyrin repeat domain-containing protein [Gammaproteobacteria bacterium]